MIVEGGVSANFDSLAKWSFVFRYLELKMVAEEEVILLRQQLVALRSALKLSEKECEEIRRDLDK